MEIMDDDKLRRDEHASVMRSRNLFLGVTLIVVGVLWMMNNLELLSDSLFDVVFSWQMLLVLIGGYLLALRKWLAGGIVAAVGLCLLLIDQLRLAYSSRQDRRSDDSDRGRIVGRVQSQEVRMRKRWGRPAAAAAAARPVCVVFGSGERPDRSPCTGRSW